MSQQEVFDLLANALRERLRVIADTVARQKDPIAHLSQLKAASDTIEQLRSQLPRTVDPQLNHFLERCSYNKALALLMEAGAR